MKTQMLTQVPGHPRLPMVLMGLGMILTAQASAADMQGMDHGMDHSSHAMPETKPVQSTPDQSRTPIPAITDADRAALYTSHDGHQVHDAAINSYFLAEKLGWQNANDGSALAWDLSGWIGGDIDRLVLRSEGERVNGKTEEAELQALWGHAVTSS